jgi:hypothetical protein
MTQDPLLQFSGSGLFERAEVEFKWIARSLCQSEAASAL